MMYKYKGIDVFELYEAAVQSPDSDVVWLDRVYKDLRGKAPVYLREDFCGTSKICCEWVKLNNKKMAMGYDLDKKTLEYAKLNHLSKLKPAQKNRIDLLHKNVLSKPQQKSDITFAPNFSFNIFKDDKSLDKYFRASKDALNRGGVFVLEMVGGPSMMEITKEETKYKKKGKPWFTYIWEQRDFNPVTHEIFCAIHFKMANGTMIKDAFTYDWRLWTIPELRNALKLAGFRDTAVYWEVEEADEHGFSTYERTENPENEECWISYVVGIK